MPIASAGLIDFALVKISVDERGEAIVSHLISFDSRRGEEVSFKVLDNSGIRVFDNLGELEFWEQNGVVSFSPRDFAENYGVTIEYSSSVMTSKTGGQWEFNFELKPLNEFSELQFELLLPRNVTLSSHEPQALVYAGGEALELEWHFENAEEPVAFSAEYFFSEPNHAGNENDFVFYFFLGAVLILVFSVSGYHYFLRQKKVEKPIEKTSVMQMPVQEKTDKVENKKEGLSEGQKDLLKLLGENEEKVIKGLLQGDKIAQRNLMAKTGLPKSTLSRTIKKLELKGLLIVHDIGNTNKIELSKEFREK